MTYIPEVHWGSGRDGNVTISTNTDLAGVEKEYYNLTVNSGVKLYDSTGMLKIRVKNKLTLNGTIDQSGFGAPGGAGGHDPDYASNGDFRLDTSTPGGNSTGVWGTPDTTAGRGGNGYSSPGSTNAGIIVTNSSKLMDYLKHIDIITEYPTRSTITPRFGVGGSGGGAGGIIRSYTAGGSGGAGGAGGGIAIIYAKRIVGTGYITCAGMPGYNGQNGGSTRSGVQNYGASGGGGGGGSGGIAIVYSKRRDTTVGVVAPGGAGGLRGYSSSGAYGQNGYAGANGLVICKDWV